MAYKMLTDLADAARRSGLEVVEMPGWKKRGRPRYTGSFDPKGHVAHHTGAHGTNTRAQEYAYVQRVLVAGFSHLPGPLCQLALGRKTKDGPPVVYVVAAGRANHAGKVRSVGFMGAGDGNKQAIGTEAINSGFEGWSDAQLDAYHRLSAAVADHYGWSRENTLSHHEVSTSGKWDPGINYKPISMSVFRRAVKAVKLGSKPSTPAPVRPPLTVTAMSFNIADKLGDDAARIKAIVRNIRAGDPDLVGLQEGGTGLAGKLLEAFTAPVWGIVKPTTALNENYLLYRKDRLTLIRQPEDTIVRVEVDGKDVPGRHVTHAIVKHLANTGWLTAHVSHLVNDDPAGAQAQAEAVIESIREHKGDRPSVLMVDRNVGGVLDALKTMQDARTSADRAFRTYVGTFARWDAPRPVDVDDAPCIDAVYWTDSWDVEQYAVIGVEPDGTVEQPRASDHLPVVSTATAPTK